MAGVYDADYAFGARIPFRVQNSQQVSAVSARVTVLMLMIQRWPPGGQKHGGLHAHVSRDLHLVTLTCQVIVYAMFDVCVVLGSAFFAIRTIHTVLTCLHRAALLPPCSRGRSSCLQFDTLLGGGERDVCVAIENGGVGFIAGGDGDGVGGGRGCDDEGVLPHAFVALLARHTICFVLQSSLRELWSHNRILSPFSSSSEVAATEIEMDGVASKGLTVELNTAGSPSPNPFVPHPFDASVAAAAFAASAAADGVLEPGYMLSKRRNGLAAGGSGPSSRHRRSRTSA
jgi:hypothetical protein